MAGDPPPWTARNGGSPTVSRHHRYRLDGTLTAIVDQLTGATRHFDLDSSGRVTAVRAAGWSETYAYDTSGNLTSGNVATATIRANNTDPPGAAPTRTMPESGGREYSGTLITRTGGTTYRYDKQGRTTTATTKRLSNKPQIWHYRYNTHDQMIAATTTDQHWTYTYDPFGRRTSKQQFGADGTITDQTRFTWDGDQLVEQARTTNNGGAITTNANGAGGRGESEVTTWEYLPVTWQPISQTVITTNDQQFYAIITDLVGTPTDLVTPDGRRVAWTNAEATLWGAPHRLGNTATKSRANCPLRFPGQYADYETGLHYNRHRYYNPTTARYTTPDPLGLTPAPDPHNYTPNPTRWTDPLGLTPCDPSEAAHSAAVGGNVNLASPRSTTHILDGNSSGGGHLWPGAPNKSVFPQDWSREQIMNHVSDVATDPTISWVQQTGRHGAEFTMRGAPVRFAAVGAREGVTIRVIIEKSVTGIVTAFPIK